MVIRKIISRRKVRVLAVTFVLLGFVYLCLFRSPVGLSKIYYFGPKDPDFQIPLGKGKDKSEILILRWTPEWSAYENVNILTSDKCPHTTSHYGESDTVSRIFDKPCRITFDRRYLSSSDALVFHSWDLIWTWMPEYRDASQPWIYMQRESPIYTKLDLQSYPNIFNWTMTYRRDSDVYHPYGHLVPVSKPNTDFEAIKSQLKQRTRLVAWIVSSCSSVSRRENLVERLQQYIEVDIYGQCGMECPSTCHGYVNMTHKFYLSFENSLCTDYITEKFFDAYRFNMVPVVYGGTQSSEYSTIAPRGSYIDARDFKSPKDIAEYLLYLDKNEEEYMKYFEWKEKFQVIYTQGWCNLCQKIYAYLNYDYDNVNERKLKSRHKWYRNLWKWWNYMSYDTSIEVDELSDSNVVGTSYNYKLGAPACLGPILNLTKPKGDGMEVTADSEFKNTRVLRKLLGWMKGIF